jgi:transketolase
MQDISCNLAQKAALLRLEILDTILKCGGGHIGGAFSAADIVSALYFHEMNYLPQNPFWEDRDRMIGKVHVPELQLCAAVLSGILPSWQRDNFCAGNLHNLNPIIPGIEGCFGSLGQSLSYGLGIALALRQKKSKARVYVITGDGEVQEGQIWEAAMAAAHYSLINIVWIIDFNSMQFSGNISDVMTINPLKDKLISFGWETLEIDGHNYSEIVDSLNMAKNSFSCPVAIIARTIKGKGVSFLENNREAYSIIMDEHSVNLAKKELIEFVESYK